MVNRMRPRRRSIRLRGYDYARAGAYCVTICTQGRKCLFGDIVDDVMRLNDAGQVTRDAWDGLPEHYAGVELDAFVVMPNHVHGIVVLSDSTQCTVGAGLKPAPTGPDVTDVDVLDTAESQPVAMHRHGLSEIVRAFKTFSSRRINEMRNVSAVPVWQRNYYEHIIRNADALNRIRKYIANNPARWELDRKIPIHRIKFDFSVRRNGRDHEVDLLTQKNLLALKVQRAMQVTVPVSEPVPVTVPVPVAEPVPVVRCSHVP